jgi:methionyl-tRNA formyltransferase
MEEAEEYSKDHEVDLVTSYLYWRIIRKPLIENPKYGCINFHPAILPDWKGCGGYNVAILYKLPEWGVTAHYVNESVDTGPIIKVNRFPFDFKTATAKSLEAKSQDELVRLYKEIIMEVKEKGRLVTIDVDNSKGTYISRQQMNEMKIITDEDLESEDLDVKIRAFWFPPYDGAYIERNGQKYTLVDKEILDTLVDKDTTALF